MEILLQGIFLPSAIVGPLGAITFKYFNNGNIGSSYYYMANTLGYSQVKDMVPSVSRVFVHPAGREAYFFSDPFFLPAESQGVVSITGTPTNKDTVIGRIRITKTGDASDLVDEVVPYTAVNTGADTITVTQDIATGDKYQLTSTGSLPSPLLTATDYYIIRINSTTIQLALTIAGTAIILTTQGSGNHTLIRQNTGEYNIETESWNRNGKIYYQLPMAIDYDGYVMPVDLNSTVDTPTNYAEGDYIASTDSIIYGSPFFPAYTANMVRGAVRNGNYIYTVQQSRKGLINNICRWLQNTIETSQPLCKFGTGTTIASGIIEDGTYMYINTNEGVYRYTFSTPTVAPILLTIAGIIDNNIIDMCLDPITGYMWTGHTTGLSKVDLIALTATQYITGVGQALEGMSIADAQIRVGQLDAYNGRVLKGGYSYNDANYAASSDAWVMDDGIGWYMVYGTINCYSCCLRKGTDQVVWNDNTNIRLISVTVSGLGTGSRTYIENFTLSGVMTISIMGAHFGQITDDTFMYTSIYSSSTYTIAVTYKIGNTPVYDTISTASTMGSIHAYRGLGFSFAAGAIKRNLIDIDGNGTYVSIWHIYLCTPYIGFSNTYGWNGSAWVKDNINSRAIPSTSTHTLLNGLSVDFNNNTGTSWDKQFVIGDHYNFVHGPMKIKDNLQEVQVKARNYFCEAHVVESYAVVVPSAAPYEITIPEASDPNFRDLDSVDFITEVFEGSTQYSFYDLAETALSVNITTDVLNVGVNIPTGTALFLQTDYDIYTMAAPLEVGKLYYAINASSTTVRVAASYADALTNTYINITTSGSNLRYKIISPTAGTYRHGRQGIFKFSSADAAKNLTLTYTYTKFTA